MPVPVSNQMRLLVKFFIANVAGVYLGVDVREQMLLVQILLDLERLAADRAVVRSEAVSRDVHVDFHVVSQEAVVDEGLVAYLTLDLLTMLVQLAMLP